MTTEQEIFFERREIYFYDISIVDARECVSTGPAGARTRRSLEHLLLHPYFLKASVFGKKKYYRI